MPPVWIRRLVFAPAVIVLAVVVVGSLPIWLIVALAALLVAIWALTATMSCGSTPRVGSKVNLPSATRRHATRLLAMDGPNPLMAVMRPYSISAAVSMP